MNLNLRQPFNGISHLIGAILSVAGLVWLVSDPESRTDAYHLVSVVLFGASLVSLYLSSSLYHLLSASMSTNVLLRKLDHIMIYILIAGSYTPICLVTLKDSVGPSLLAVIWLIALAGAIKDLFWIDAPRWVSSSIYVGMGWLCLIAFPQMIDALPGMAIFLLLLEGAVYTLGAVVYTIRWPNPFPMVFGFHGIWHIFVLGGSALHFAVVKGFVL